MRYLWVVYQEVKPDKVVPMIQYLCGIIARSRCMCDDREKIFRFMLLESARQEQTLNLIASENYASDAVKMAAASAFTDKYAEGYSGKRYYAGCEYVDMVETYAIELAKELFGAEHANVQPHSGSNANLAVYMSCLQPGDTVLGMSLSAGGHLTHGHPNNISGKLFKFVSYGVDKLTERLDYDEVERLAREHHPKLLVAGASSYPRFIDYERLAAIAHANGALFMVDMAHVAGLIAAGVHPNPVPYADFVTTTTHKTLRGPRGGMILCKAQHAAAIDKAVMPGIQGGPLMHLIAAKAVALCEAKKESFEQYQRQVVENAKVMAQAFEMRGYRVVSGGTDNHLFMVDLSGRTDGSGAELTGRLVERRLDACGITLNRNAIPFDSKSTLVTSGIRIGTPALTSRGMGSKEMLKVVELILTALKATSDQDPVFESIRSEVAILCKRFPTQRQEPADSMQCSC